MNKIIEKIIKNYKTNKSLYIGEKVTMSEHMIQSAMLAEKNKSSSSLIKKLMSGSVFLKRTE